MDNILTLFKQAHDDLKAFAEQHRQLMEINAHKEMPFEDRIEIIHAEGGVYDQGQMKLQRSKHMRDFLKQHLTEELYLLYWKLERAVRNEHYDWCATLREKIAGRVPVLPPVPPFHFRYTTADAQD